MFASIAALSLVLADAPRVASRPMPNAPWLLTQLVPSPQLRLGGSASGGGFGMQWQVTPVLYSFGANRRVSPWRSFIAEPVVRQSGSVEWFVSPEYVAASDRDVRAISLRSGVRTYFPVLQRGEYLSVSMGSSYSTYGKGGVGYELGAYVLYGVVGLQLTLSPSPSQPPCILTFRLRYF